MEAKNLRIGNLITIKSTALHYDVASKEVVFEVGELKEDVLQFKGFHTGEFYKDVKGIELNLGWLKLFGFEHDQHNYYKYTYGRNGQYLLYKIGNSHLEMCLNGSTTAQAVMNYVHELQNLFFALTGTELELKHKSSACS